MNRTPDVQLVLRDWLADDGDIAPDRILNSVADRIGRQPQRRTWRLQGRPFMTTYAKLAATAAAIVIVGFVGWQLLPGSGGIGGPPTPAPTPTITPTEALASPPAASSAAAIFPDWFTGERDSSAAGILPAGSAATRAFLAGSTFTVPSGWVNTIDTADFFGLFPDTPANEAEYGRSGSPGEGIFMGIVDTPDGLICDGIAATGSTTAELVDSLVANAALVTSARVEVAIGGLAGARVDAHLDPAVTGTCPLAPEDPPTKDYYDYRGRFVFLDIPAGGRLLIIIDSVHSAGFEAFLAEAMPLIESFEFDLGQ